jgi:aspartate kinase
MPGTLITAEDKIMENAPVTGLAYSKDIARITLFQVQDKPGTAAKVFGGLARAGINVGMIVQPASGNNETTDITFTVAKKDLTRALEIMEDEKDKIGFASIKADKNVAKLSVVGSGMRTQPSVAYSMFQALCDSNINIQAIETSEINISVLIPEDYLELALRVLHTTFKLDK